ncbi:helix-turn-helix domain-containing protein [Micavibrio aeruginosavorus]|uniref:helix-turn-helix domain-containing protein n=1 Tax=Micavibrio aeruginosavorus TaxID=349221 RepID=UPI0016514CF1|nr:helix-turn-helix transcriptional regulator [Micavibrio aeruginosavorus]
MKNLSRTITPSGVINNAASRPKTNGNNVVHRNFYCEVDYAETVGLTSHQDFLAELADSGFENAIRDGRKRLGASLSHASPTLKSLRLQAGLSQADLEEMTGIRQYQISRYEAGKDSPTAANMQRLIGALNTDIATLWVAAGYKT